MKKRIGVFLAGAVCANAIFAALAWHVILAADGIVVERKATLSLADTVVDTRGWGLLDYGTHPRIGAVLAARRARGVFVSGSDAGKKVRGAFDGVSGSDAAKKAREALDGAKKALEKAAEELRR
jgi:hypothetical protein